MIKIILGHFGHHNGKYVELKNKDSEPFSTDADIEANLVNQGIAEYIKGGETPPLIDSKTPYDETMKMDILKEIASKGHNISEEELAKCKSRKSIVELIDNAKAKAKEEAEAAEKFETLKTEAKTLNVPVDEADTFESLQIKIDKKKDEKDDDEEEIDDSEGGGAPPLGNGTEAVQ